MSLNSPWPGKIKLFPARESLVSDIPAGDGKIATFFTVCAFLGKEEGHHGGVVVKQYGQQKVSMYGKINRNSASLGKSSGRVF
jgi:hypothetical protein